MLLVHGLGGSRSSWSAVAQTLSARGLTVDAVAYAPLGPSVAQLADQLVAEVARILSRTGAAKVHLVGHSLGGVVIAQAIADGGLDGLVDTVVTLGSPFGGSPWAGVLPFVEIVRALRPGSQLLQRLASTPIPDGVRWLAVTAALDIIVPGLRSVPSHARAESIRVNGVGHLGMLRSSEVIECITAALSASRVGRVARRAAPRRFAVGGNEGIFGGFFSGRHVLGVAADSGARSRLVPSGSRAYWRDARGCARARRQGVPGELLAGLMRGVEVNTVRVHQELTTDSAQHADQRRSLLLLASTSDLIVALRCPARTMLWMPVRKVASMPTNTGRSSASSVRPELHSTK